MESTVLTVFTLCCVYLSFAEGFKENNRFITENGISKDIQEYISNIVLEITEKHDNDIKGLKSIINSQGRKIKHLETDNVMYVSTIRDLEKRIENIEMKTDDTKQMENDTISYESARKETLSGSEHIMTKRNNKARQSLQSNARRGLQSQLNSRSERKRRGAVENEVAFFATMTSNAVQLGKGQDIVFDNAITNVGNAFNAHHGTFVAPTAGIYVFAVTLFHHSSMSTTPASWGSVMVNNHRVALLHVTQEQSSQTVIVKLNVGDDVSVQNVNAGGGFFGNLYSTFSGFLLYQDFSAGQVVG